LPLDLAGDSGCAAVNGLRLLAFRLMGLKSRTMLRKFVFTLV
jgi:hypothetical protein